jgi:2-octaprenyl-6-methoxyphenol hydroxylase
VADEFDIVIVGGGMVGATLALVLGRRHYRVALVEAHAYGGGAQPSYDERAIALSWGSSRILNQLGLWPALTPYAEPITAIHVSDRGHFGLTHIDAREENVPALGYVVTASEFGQVLTGHLSGRDTERLCLYCPASPCGLNAQAGSCVELELDTGDRLKAGLVIAADGARSAVRRLLGVRAEQTDYGQHAIVANLTPQRPSAGRAFERFTESGPIAVLPMRPYKGGPRSALIWTVPARDADRLMAAGEADFLDELQTRFGHRLGRLEAVGRRRAYPLSLVESGARTAGRVVFLGNAAQSLHPVAGQGFNLALRDTAALLDCLLYPGPAGDPGDPALLCRYQASRRGDQRRVIRFTDTLIKVFSNRRPALGCARAAALSMLDTCPPLRRALARQSMGLSMPLPHVPGDASIKEGD